MEPIDTHNPPPTHTLWTTYSSPTELVPLKTFVEKTLFFFFFFGQSQKKITS